MALETLGAWGSWHVFLACPLGAPTHWASLLLGLRHQELPQHLQDDEVAAAVDTEFDFSSGPHPSM